MRILHGPPPLPHLHVHGSQLGGPFSKVGDTPAYLHPKKHFEEILRPFLPKDYPHICFAALLLNLPLGSKTYLQIK